MENSDINILEEQPIQLVLASPLKRLLNYLVDFILFNFLAALLLIVLTPYYGLATRIMEKQATFSDQLILTFAYGLFMSILESLLKGRSIGKLITGTRAVYTDGQPISSHTAFVRGLIRVIPLEQLSILFQMPMTWHDRWSGSAVIDEAKSIIPNKN